MVLRHLASTYLLNQRSTEVRKLDNHQDLGSFETIIAMVLSPKTTPPSTQNIVVEPEQRTHGIAQKVSCKSEESALTRDTQKVRQWRK